MGCIYSEDQSVPQLADGEKKKMYSYGPGMD